MTPAGCTHQTRMAFHRVAAARKLLAFSPFARRSLRCLSSLTEPVRTVHPAPERLVCFGDVHGDSAGLETLLDIARVVDADGNWCGGSDVLVQIGDVLDRGVGELDMILRLHSLRTQAQAAGGDVICLMGNHELMNYEGDFRCARKHTHCAISSTSRIFSPRSRSTFWVAGMCVANGGTGSPRSRRTWGRSWTPRPPAGAASTALTRPHTGRRRGWRRSITECHASTRPLPPSAAPARPR